MKKILSAIALTIVVVSMISIAACKNDGGNVIEQATPTATAQSSTPTMTPEYTPSEIPAIPTQPPTESIIVDHRCTDLDEIPQEWIEQAKSELVIAYGHTSHGSQITTGMSGLVGFGGDLYAWNEDGSGGALQLKDGGLGSASDLGNPNFAAWESTTRDYLDSHPSTNVVMWSWCGQVSGATSDDIDTYLGLMSGLEDDYPNVHFVYMTGHTDGSGLEGNLHIRNQQIRDYCTTNSKILYDFEDIESYDPDGNYFGDKYVTDSCDYDGGNWAVEWQDSHTEGVDWYQCSSAHSQPLNANLKAYAAWWLWARLSGWSGNI